MLGGCLQARMMYTEISMDLFIDFSHFISPPFLQGAIATGCLGMSAQPFSGSLSCREKLGTTGLDLMPFGARTCPSSLVQNRVR